MHHKNVGLVKQNKTKQKISKSKSGFYTLVGGEVCMHKKSITQQANKLILSTAIQNRKKKFEKSA